MKRLLIVIGATAAFAAIAFVVYFMLKPPGMTVKADEFVSDVTRSLPQAQEKYLYRWVRVQGKVRSVVEVSGDEGQFWMVDLETKTKPDVQASFSGRDAPVQEGDEVTLDGYCALCEPTVIYLESCRIAERLARK